MSHRTNNEDANVREPGDGAEKIKILKDDDAVNLIY